VVEFARNCLGLKGANSVEFDRKTPYPVIDLLPEQRKIKKMGATMRLGAQDVKVTKGSMAFELYSKTRISERHRHRYEVNPEYISKLMDKGVRFTGKSPDLKRMEILELQDHPFFIASQFHPEFKSRPIKPAPLYFGFVKAALKFANAKGF